MNNLLSLPPIRTWYLPTTFGDIRLRADDDSTQVEICKLTAAELKAVLALRAHSTGMMRRWSTDEAWAKLPSRAFETSDTKTTIIQLDAPIHKVEAFLTKALRRDRGVVTVMTSKPGEYTDITASAAEQKDDEHTPYRTPAKEPKTPKGEKAEIVPAAAAVTVQQPVLGCPAPEFPDQYIRASEVLRAFLLPEQVEDFERHQQFVTVGGYTGHRYAITSRHALSHRSMSHRTVYDLDERRDYCVHDWDIPAPEEMLTMHLLLSMPHWEPWIRRMPEMA